MPISKTRLRVIKAIRDEDIEYSDIPELQEDFFRQAQVILPEQLDPEVLRWFQNRYGKEYVSQISEVLRHFMETNA